MKIKIDKNVPLQSNRYPFDEMVVGDSFAIPCTKEQAAKIQSSIKSGANNYAKRHGNNHKHLTKRIYNPTTGELECIRIWRIQ